MKWVSWDVELFDLKVVGEGLGIGRLSFISVGIGDCVAELLKFLIIIWDYYGFDKF